MFKKGQRVQVVEITDDAISEKYLGRIGTIYAIDYNEDIGVPFYRVKFRGLPRDGFWEDELIAAEHAPHSDAAQVVRPGRLQLYVVSIAAAPVS